jgi:hypothetical protein
MNEAKANQILSECCYLPIQQRGKCQAALMRDEKLVYFIQARDGGPVKIGIALDPLERMRYLQSANSFELNCLWLTPGDGRTERKLHHKFRDSHIRGEWFYPSDELLKYCRVKNPKQGSNAFLAFLLQRAWQRGFDMGYRIGPDTDKKLKRRIESLEINLREARAQVNALSRTIEMTSEARSQRRKERMERMLQEMDLIYDDGKVRMPEPLDLDEELGINQD